VIAVTPLAVLLVAVVPVSLLAAVVLKVLGHVAGGPALFAGSVVAAARPETPRRWCRGALGREHASECSVPDQDTTPDVRREQIFGAMWVIEDHQALQDCST